MRIDKHQYMFRSDIVKNVIQLSSVTTELVASPINTHWRSPSDCPFCLIDKTLCLKH